ncbi:MAG: ribosome maturation factor RimM [Myxococcota bacterium]
MTSAPSDAVALGKVTRPHGVRGQVRVYPYNRDSKLWKNLIEVFVVQGSQTQALAVRSASVGPKFVILNLEGVAGHDKADALRGAEVFVPREALPDLKQDEYYYADLPGMRVVDESGQVLGEALRVLNYPAVDCLEVRGTEGGIREVPLQRPWLRDVGDAVVVREWDDLPERSG